MHSVITQIVERRRQWVEQQVKIFPAEALESRLEKCPRDFEASLRKRHPAHILECKPGSPTKGVIRANYDSAREARSYAAWADALSVLTEPTRFGGKHEDLRRVRQVCNLPLLNKDFFVDPYQVLLARDCGADAVLLMLSLLDDKTYLEMRDLAHKLGMCVLTEAGCAEEVQRALAHDVTLLGLNNRDFNTLEVDLKRSSELAEVVPPEVLVVAESGYTTHLQLRQARSHASAFLIGSALMAETDLDLACRKLLIGEHKVCGLCAREDWIAAAQSGACYGGLIFAPDSPRRINPAQAATLINSATLHPVGVFQNQPRDEVIQTAAQLNLRAVQLHGRESREWVRNCREELPVDCMIWKALTVDDPELPLWQSEQAVERLILDNRHPGSGEPWDWNRIPELKKPFMLAGGVGPDNVLQAQDTPALALDFNSRLEERPGKKRHDLLKTVFEQLRGSIQ